MMEKGMMVVKGLGKSSGLELNAWVGGVWGGVVGCGLIALMGLPAPWL